MSLTVLGFRNEAVNFKCLHAVLANIRSKFIMKIQERPLLTLL